MPVPALLCACPPVTRATVFPGGWLEERQQPPQQRPGHAGLPSCCPAIPAVPLARLARAGPGSPAPSGPREHLCLAFSLRSCLLG